MLLGFLSCRRAFEIAQIGCRDRIWSSGFYSLLQSATCLQSVSVVTQTDSSSVMVTPQSAISSEIAMREPVNRQLRSGDSRLRRGCPISARLRLRQVRALGRLGDGRESGLQAVVRSLAAARVWARLIRRPRGSGSGFLGFVALVNTLGNHADC